MELFRSPLPGMLTASAEVAANGSCQSIWLLFFKVLLNTHMQFHCYNNCGLPSFCLVFACVKVAAKVLQGELSDCTVTAEAV